MKYIEELIAGQTFVKDNHIFLLTTDYKKDGSKLAVSIEQGNLRWFKPNDMINTVPIFKLDENNNVIPIIETISENYKIS
jgi:hypothetical protein